MKKLDHLFYYSVLLFLSSCGGKETKQEEVSQEETKEKIEVTSEVNGESLDFENMSCKEYLEGYEKFMEEYKVFMEKYKDVDNNDYAAVIRASNDMSELAKDQGEWTKASGEFLIKCIEEESFVEKMEQIQKKLNSN